MINRTITCSRAAPLLAYLMLDFILWIFCFDLASCDVSVYTALPAQRQTKSIRLATSTTSDMKPSRLCYQFPS